LINKIHMQAQPQLPAAETLTEKTVDEDQG
jgi:hypothetical protein